MSLHEKLKTKRKLVKTILAVLPEVVNEVAAIKAEDFPGRTYTNGTVQLMEREQKLRKQLALAQASIVELEEAIRLSNVTVRSIKRNQQGQPQYPFAEKLQSEFNASRMLVISKKRMARMGISLPGGKLSDLDIMLECMEVEVLVTATVGKKQLTAVLQDGVLIAHKMEGMKPMTSDVKDLVQQILNHLGIANLKQQKLC